MVICDTPKKASVLLENVEKGLTPGLRLIILMDPFEDDLRQRGEQKGVEILSFYDAEVMGGSEAGLTPWASGLIYLAGHLHKSSGCCSPGWQDRSKLDSCCEASRIISPRQPRNHALGGDNLWPACTDFQVEVAEDMVLERGTIS